MEVFAFDVAILTGCMVDPEGSALQLQATLKHFGKEVIALGSPFGGEALRLGILGLGDQPLKPILENRAIFQRPRLEPHVPHSFTFEIPSELARSCEFVILFDLVKEDDFWFRDRGISPSLSAVKYDGQFLDVRRTNYSDYLNGQLQREHLEASLDLSRVNERTYAKNAPEFLAAVSDGVTAISDAFGPTLAIEFAYCEILGRRGDPLGLVEKSRSLSGNRERARGICAQMLASDEYNDRRISRHRDPEVVMKSWTNLNDVK